MGHFIDSSWTKVLTVLVLNFEIQIKARPFELTLKPNWPSCLPLSSSTALQIKTQSYVLDFQNPFLYLPGPLMRAFHVRPPNIFILFLIRGTSRRKSKVPRHWYCWGVDEDKTLANIGKIQILAGMHHIIGWHEVGGEQRQPCVSFKVVQS